MHNHAPTDGHVNLQFFSIWSWQNIITANIKKLVANLKWSPWWSGWVIGSLAFKNSICICGYVISSVTDARAVNNELFALTTPSTQLLYQISLNHAIQFLRNLCMHMSKSEMSNCTWFFLNPNFYQGVPNEAILNNNYPH